MHTVFLILLLFVSAPCFAKDKKHSKEKPFVIGTLNGRLGNQMFEIATACSLAIDNDAEALFPDLICKKGDDIPKNHKIFFTKLNPRIPHKPARYKNIEDAMFNYAPIKYRPNMKLEGFYQSEKYFKHNADKILPLFEPLPEIKEYLTNKYRNLLNHPKTVAIHLRAYKSEIGENGTFEDIGRKYVEKAAKYFGEDAYFVVFSDNMTWAKEIMDGFSRPHEFIEGEAYYHDFYLMSFCRHQIISNSTFAWWAAYLNKNIDKVIIAPKIWFKVTHPLTDEHIVPVDWVKI